MIELNKINQHCSDMEKLENITRHLNPIPKTISSWSQK